MNNMTPSNHAPAAKKWSRRKKCVATLVGLLVLGGLVGLPVYWLTRPHAPDPIKLTQEQAIKYMASKQFASLPEPEKEDYMKKVRLMAGDDRRALFRQNLSEDERRAMMQNTRAIMQKEMKARMRKFFAMSKEDQMKALQEDIARWEKEGRGGRGGPGGPGGQAQGGGPGGPPGGGNRSAMMRQMLEGTDSTTRAQMAVYRQMMRQAAQQNQANKK